MDCVFKDGLRLFLEVRGSTTLVRYNYEGNLANKDWKSNKNTAIDFQFPLIDEFQRYAFFKFLADMHNASMELVGKGSYCCQFKSLT
jgi:hypothetical protein